MVLNLHSLSVKALDGGVGGSDALMDATDMHCPRVAEQNVSKYSTVMLIHKVGDCVSN